MFKNVWIFSLVCILGVLTGHLSTVATAGQLESTPEEFQAKLNYRQGTIDVRSGLATLNLSPEFRYLDPEQSRRVLVKAWGNPPDSANGVLGMIFPSDLGPFDRNGWAVVVTYEEDGYVSDEGAETINYGKLLAEMQGQAKQVNEEREKQGYPPVELVGWAEVPRYDRAAHKLYWAKELKFGNEPVNTVNYNIRVLGRQGVLVLNAVATMDRLPTIQTGMSKVLKMVDFREGHRYTDYLPGKDKVAEYGIATLVVGGVAAAAKAGLLKWIIAGILAFKKLIVVGVLALGGSLRKLFGRNSSDQVSPTATDTTLMKH